MEEAKALPARYMRLSRYMAVFGFFLLCMASLFLISPWSYGLTLGAASGGLGLTILFTALYYWGCSNESCS